jgi:hypothetical protein
MVFNRAFARHRSARGVLPDVEHATRISAGQDEKKVSELVARAVRAQRHAPQPRSADPNDPLED